MRPLRRRIEVWQLERDRAAWFRWARAARLAHESTGRLIQRQITAAWLVAAETQEGT